MISFDYVSLGPRRVATWIGGETSEFAKGNRETQTRKGRGLPNINLINNFQYLFFFCGKLKVSVSSQPLYLLMRRFTSQVKIKSLCRINLVTVPVPFFNWPPWFIASVVSNPKDIVCVLVLLYFPTTDIREFEIYDATAATRPQILQT